MSTHNEQVNVFDGTELIAIVERKGTDIIIRMDWDEAMSTNIDKIVTGAVQKMRGLTSVWDC